VVSVSHPILSDENLALQESLREFTHRYCPKDAVREWDNAAEHPSEVYAALTEHGFMGVAIDEEYGGSGGDILAQALVFEELSRAMQGSAQLWMTTSCFGGRTIGLHGNEEQKHRFLPAICKGELHFAISITEPGGGTDVLGHMETHSRKVDGGWIVNGSKIFTTGIDHADYVLLVTRSLSDDELKKKSDGITLFLCPVDAPGLTYFERPTLGLRTLRSFEVHYDDVFIADDLVLGEPHRGWSLLMQTLNNERILSAAFSVGCAQAALDDAIAYAKEREAFGKPIGSFQAVAHHVANMAIALEQARLLMYRAAWLQARELPCGMEATMAKCAAGEAASLCSDLGIQVLGGMGLSFEHDMQRYWRDSRVMRVSPISNEMSRNFIAMELGLPRNY
jgi:acyl-CoA dehydrogenase